MTEEAWDLVRHHMITLLFLGMVLILISGAARGMTHLIVEAIKELRDDADQRRQHAGESYEEKGEQ